MSERVGRLAQAVRDHFDRTAIPVDSLRPTEHAMLDALAAYEIVADARQPESPEVYVDRNLVVQAFAQAMEREGYQVWWGEDEAEPDWPVLYVETDEGQVSWHIPKGERIYEPPIRPEHGGREWDGHTTPEKFDRLRAWLRDVAS